MKECWQYSTHVIVQVAQDGRLKKLAIITKSILYDSEKKVIYMLIIIIIVAVQPYGISFMRKKAKKINAKDQCDVPCKSTMVRER